MKHFTNRKYILVLTLIYCLSQGFIVVASGRWWDDWCLHNISYMSLKLWGMQMGRPSVILITKFAKLMPEWGYRFLTFVMYYFCMLFAYKIIKLWIGATDKTCFWICAIYATLPANDSRIVLSCFPYSIGLFFFMLGFSNLAGMLFMKGITLKNRMISYCLFLISFSLNSNLCFYAVVLMMILLKEKKFKKCIHYIDYLFLPILFYVFKSIFFPTYGLYENYNTLTWEKIINASKIFIPADFYVFYKLISTYFNEMMPGSKLAF